MADFFLNIGFFWKFVITYIGSILEIMILGTTLICWNLI
jgi:hypothetical protein